MKNVGVHLIFDRDSSVFKQQSESAIRICLPDWSSEPLRSRTYFAVLLLIWAQQ